MVNYRKLKIRYFRFGEMICMFSFLIVIIYIAFMPPLFGVIAENINIGLYPFYMAVFAVLMVVCSEWLNKKVSERN